MSQTAFALRFVPLLQQPGEGGEELLLQVIHTAPVESVGLGVLANGQAIHKPFPKVIPVVRQNGLEITPEQWTVLIFLWEKDGVTQQELCNATFKDKPSMTRLIDNMERQHLVVRISDKKDRRTNLIHLTKDGKELEERARVIANQTLKEALKGITIEELSVSQEVLRKIFFNTKD